MADPTCLRVLHITRNLPPLVGGMERLNWHIADELSQYADICVIGPEGAEALKPERVALVEIPLRPLGRFLICSTWQAISIAWRRRPEIILAGSGLTAPAAWIAARLCRAQAAVYVHGLDIAVRHPVYRALWHPVIRRMDTIIANSRPTVSLARELGIPESKLRIVHPGVGLPDAPQLAENLEAFRERHGVGNAKLMLSIGRLTTRKGLCEFVQLALPTIVKQAPDALLMVIGDTPVDSLSAGAQSRESIQAVADAAGIGGNLCFLGGVTESELSCAYESADVHVFPVREIPGDPEGFGMVAIEAAAHGLPTVAFASGGVIDAVAEGESGYLVAQGDYSAFAQCVLQVLGCERGSWKSRAIAFSEQFAWPIFGRRLMDALGFGKR